MKPEDVIVMVMSNPPVESVARLMQARNETAEIEALALMEPPHGSFNIRSQPTDPLLISFRS
jgi:hypothetical protein